MAAVPMCKLANENKMCKTYTNRNKSSDRCFLCEVYKEGRLYVQRMPPTDEDEEEHYQLCATLPSHL